MTGWRGCSARATQPWSYLSEAHQCARLAIRHKRSRVLSERETGVLSHTEALSFMHFLQHHCTFHRTSMLCLTPWIATVCRRNYPSPGKTSPPRW